MDFKDGNRPVKLLEQVHGDEGQQAVLGRADGVALVFLGQSCVLLLEGAMAGKHSSPFSTGPLRGAFVGRTIRGGVPASA